MAQIDPVYEALGRRIRAARLHAGISQDELARRVRLTRTSITNIERGRQQIQVHTLYTIAKALDARLAMLLPAAEESVTNVEDQFPSAPEEREWVRRVLAPALEGL